MTSRNVDRYSGPRTKRPRTSRERADSNRYNVEALSQSANNTAREAYLDARLGGTPAQVPKAPTASGTSARDQDTFFGPETKSYELPPITSAKISKDQGPRPSEEEALIGDMQAAIDKTDRLIAPKVPAKAKPSRSKSQPEGQETKTRGGAQTPSEVEKDQVRNINKTFKKIATAPLPPRIQARPPPLRFGGRFRQGVGIGFKAIGGTVGGVVAAALGIAAGFGLSKLFSLAKSQIEFAARGKTFPVYGNDVVTPVTFVETKEEADIWSKYEKRYGYYVTNGFTHVPNIYPEKPPYWDELPEYATWSRDDWIKDMDKKFASRAKARIPGWDPSIETENNVYMERIRAMDLEQIGRVEKDVVELLQEGEESSIVAYDLSREFLPSVANFVKTAIETRYGIDPSMETIEPNGEPEPAPVEPDAEGGAIGGEDGGEIGGDTEGDLEDGLEGGATDEPDDETPDVIITPDEQTSDVTPIDTETGNPSVDDAAHDHSRDVVLPIRRRPGGGGSGVGGGDVVVPDPANAPIKAPDGKVEFDPIPDGGNQLGFSNSSSGAAFPVSGGFNIFLARELFAWASAVYDNDGNYYDKIKTHYKCYESHSADGTLKMLMGYDQDESIIAIRGTTNASNWVNNLDVRLAKVTPVQSGIPVHLVAQLHRGFYNAYLACRPSILEFLRRFRRDKVFMTGHSLGGAVAHIASLEIKRSLVYSFGAPKFCMEDCVTYMDKQTKSLDSMKVINWRVVVRGDPIPELPPLYWFKKLDHVAIFHNGGWGIGEIGLKVPHQTTLQNHSRKSYYTNLRNWPVLGESIRYNVRAGQFQDTQFPILSAKAFGSKRKRGYI